MERCEHLEFNANVAVNRIVDKGAFTADIRITCRTCGLPFEFVGVGYGSSPTEPRMSIDGQELRAPIIPKGENVPTGMMGFDIRRVE